MTKEERIKEAWGEYWDFFYYLTQQRILSNIGSVDYFLLSKEEKEDTEILLGDIRKLECTKTDEGTERYFRPKSLQGIENNNGWIKIESEADLPKDNGITDYHVFMFTNQYKYIRRTYKKNEVKELWEQEEITHYQPIEKPKPPIY